MGFVLKDSGEREVFNTGARRDVRTDKGRFDLISPIFLKRLAIVLERGAIKYGSRNWEKGIPLGRYLDSALRHISQVLAGDDDEDHATQAAWNLHAFIHTAQLIEDGKLPIPLDDIGYVVKGEVAPPSDVADEPPETDEVPSLNNYIPRGGPQTSGREGSPATSEGEACPPPVGALSCLAQTLRRHLEFLGPRPAARLRRLYLDAGWQAADLARAFRDLHITCGYFDGAACVGLPQHRHLFDAYRIGDLDRRETCSSLVRE